MNTGRTVFSQIMDCLPMHEFRKCVKRYRGNYKVKSFSCLDQFLCMAFAQLTYRESLRDIEACLRSRQNKLFHMGIRGRVSRNTLAHANETREWRIYADFAQVLINHARGSYADEDFGVELEETVYVLDSTTIDLCLSLFPWAKFRKHKGAIKLHTFFIIRAKSNLQFRRLYSHPINKSTGLRCDQTIALTGINSAEYYPEQLCRVRFFDKETNNNLIFLSNNFILPAYVIA